VGVVFVLATAAAAFWAFWRRQAWAEAAFAPLSTACALWWMDIVYRWQRRAAYVRREKRRKNEPAYDLLIPDGVKKPEEYEGVTEFHALQWKYIGRAVEAQGNYFRDGIVVAILPPLALFLLSFQILAEGKGAWAVGLIAAEVFCLSLLLIMTWTKLEPTTEWVSNRLRSEILRREQYLVLAGVGPYLGKPAVEVSRVAARRRAEIESANREGLVALIPLQQEDGSTWLEALFRSGLRAQPDCVDRMRSYYYRRIGKQLLWFANEVRDLDENERLWSNLLKGALFAAIGGRPDPCLRLVEGDLSRLGRHRHRRYGNRTAAAGHSGAERAGPV